MRSQYQGVRPIPPAPTVVVSAGGSITAAKAGSYTVYLQTRNRAGYSQPSVGVPFTVAAGQRVTIQVPSATRQSGEDVQEFTLSLSLGLTNNPVGSFVVAAVAGKVGSDLVSLPAIVTLNLDEHFNIGVTVPTEAALPISTLNGMRRQITSLGMIYQYNAALNKWGAVYPNSFSAYQILATSLGGANADIRNITDPRVVISPSYAATGGDSQKVGFWIVNDDVNPVAQGTRIVLSVSIGGVDSSDLFAQNSAMYLEFEGFVDIATGTIDTTGVGGIGTMSGVGTPSLYQNHPTNLKLEKDLPPGFAYLVYVYINFTPNTINGRIQQGAAVSVFPYFSQFTGVYTSIGGLIGDTVYRNAKDPDDGLRRLYPSSGLAVQADQGSGIVNGFEFSQVGTQLVTGFVANQDNQNAIITGNGTVLASPGTIPSNTALRAYVGSLDGVGYHSPLAGSYVVGASSVIALAFTYPSNIRNSYPDVIAGATVPFSATGLRCYLKNSTDTNLFYYYDHLAVPGEMSGSMVLGLATASTLGALPSPSDPKFDFYTIATNNFVGATQSGAAQLPTGVYSVSLAPLYKNAISSIQHNENCVNELTVTIAELTKRSKYWAPPAIDISQLKAIPLVDRSLFQSRIIREATSNDLLLFSFDPSGDEAEDLVKVVTPNDGSGRWKRVAVASRKGLGAKNLYYVTGASAPSPSVGIVNDFAINDNGVLFEKTGDATWVDRIDLVTGAELSSATAGLITQTTADTRYAPLGESPGSGARYTFNVLTTIASVASGEIRFDNATSASITFVTIHKTDRNGGAMATFLDLVSVGSKLQIAFDASEETYSWFNVTGITDSGAYRTFAVTHIASNGTRANGEVVLGIFGSAGSTLTVREIDGTPSVSASVIEFPNGSLTDQGGGVARLNLSSGGGHIIQDEATDLPQRSKLAIVGAGATATDDVTGDRTVITIPGATGGGGLASQVITASQMASDGIVHICDSTTLIEVTLPTAGSHLAVSNKGTGGYKVRNQSGVVVQVGTTLVDTALKYIGNTNQFSYAEFFKLGSTWLAIVIANTAYGVDIVNFAKALLHFNTAVGSAPVDAVSSTRVITLGGSAAITSGGKFGNGITLAYNSYFEFTVSDTLGTNDFCLEFFFYSNDGNPTNNFYLAMGRGTDAQRTAGTLATASDGNGNICLLGGTFLSIAGTGGAGNQYSGIWSGSVKHVAVVRHGDIFTYYLDGAVTTNLDASAISTWTGGSFNRSLGTTPFNVRIGSQPFPGGNNYGRPGIYDELRLTIGDPVYTAAFTPPTTEFVYP